MKEFPTSVKVDPEHPIGQAITSVLHADLSNEFIESLIGPFRCSGDSDDAGWRGEFWGKWALSVIESMPFSPPERTLELLSMSVREVVTTQQVDGYIGTYGSQRRWSGFDLWNTKYTMWALAAYGKTFRDDSAVNAASRLLELVKGLAHSTTSTGFIGHSIAQLEGAGVASMLDPLHYMYTELGLSSARDVAETILAELEGKAPTKVALGGFLVEHWDEKPPVSWPGGKAYELMATLEGVLKWASLLGNDALVDRMLKRVRLIIDEEVFITGSGSSFELFSSGRRREASPILQPQETCVTVHWMRLCETAGLISGEPLFYDQLSRSVHNALLAAVDEDGKWWSYFCPLAGRSAPSHRQFGEIPASCCVSNGPRGLFSLARWAVLLDREQLNVNLPIPGRYSFERLAEDTPSHLEVEISRVPDDPNMVHIISQPQTTLNVPAQISKKGEIPSIDGACEGLTQALHPQGINILGHPHRTDVWAMEVGPFVFALDGRSLPPSPHYLWTRNSLVLQSAGPLDTWQVTADFENRPSHYFNFSKVSAVFRPYYVLARASRKDVDARYRVWIENPLVVSTFDALGEILLASQSVDQLSAQEDSES